MTQLSTSPELEPFWSAAARGELVLPGCEACSKTHWYPRHVCPFCHAVRTQWRSHGGAGEILSYTVVRHGQDPYATAYVKLEDGPTVLTTIVDTDLDALSIGLKVKARFRPDGESRPPALVFSTSSQ